MQNKRPIVRINKRFSKYEIILNHHHLLYEKDTRIVVENIVYIQESERKETAEWGWTKGNSEVCWMNEEKEVGTKCTELQK